MVRGHDREYQTFKKVRVLIQRRSIEICYEPFFFSFFVSYLREFALKFLSDIVVSKISIVATIRHATRSFEFITIETRSNSFDTCCIELQ